MPLPNLVVIGASTGGLKVFESLFPRLPVLNAGVVIVQHIIPLVDRSFVASLQRVSAMPVALARDGDAIRHGTVYLAPGALHLHLVANQAIHLAAGEKVNSVCPSIDVAMKSVIPKPGARIAGVILTGMGHDGADGIAHMKRCGAVTIAQDKTTSVIYGMPKAAEATGMIDFVLSTERIADKLAEFFKK